jgi:hypothetical protein
MPDGLKWQVNRAIRASTLPPPSRLIMLTLSDIAHAKTAELPPKYTPSIAQLALETGLSESTVKKHRALLEVAGWIAVTRPTAAEASRHVRCKYRLAIPADFVPGGRDVAPSMPERSYEEAPESESAGATRRPPRGPRDDPRTDGAGPPHDPPGGHLTTPPGATSRPPKNYNHYDLDNQELPSTADAAAAAQPPKHAAADELTADFWERHHTNTAQSFIAVRGIVRTAIANDLPRDDVARALDRLANEGRAISGGTLTTALTQIRGAPTQAEPPRPPSRPGPPLICPIHRLELPDSGICRGCAADARAADDDFDLDARPPAPPRREPRARDPDAAAPSAADDLCTTCDCCTVRHCWPGPAGQCADGCPCFPDPTT